MTIKQKLAFILLTILTPFSKWIGSIYAPYSIKPIIKEYYNFVDLLQPMDVILSYTKGYAANFLVPSKHWKHVSLYTGKENNIPIVVEALEKGVTKRPLVELISEIDKIAILRYKNIDVFCDVQRGLEFIFSQIGKPYDYLFDDFTKNKFKAFFCSELIVSTLKISYPNLILEVSPTYLTSSTTPDDIFKSQDMEVLFVEVLFEED